MTEDKYNKILAYKKANQVTIAAACKHFGVTDPHKFYSYTNYLKKTKAKKVKRAPKAMTFVVPDPQPEVPEQVMMSIMRLSAFQQFLRDNKWV